MAGGGAARSTVEELRRIQADIAACRVCPDMVGPPVHGPPVPSPVLLIGQAPGPREAGFGKPFAWTAGRTLFRWLEGATGADEERVRERIHFVAVARCFPGKAPGGGDRRPAPDEIARCSRFLTREVPVLQPRLIIPVGTLAITEALGHTGKLADVVGTVRRVGYFGAQVDAIALPHPSGASTWHRTQPGIELLARALELLAGHEAMREALAA
ncbi:MAG: uracil-DNA glycosylase family protein [Thermoleophilia bacterium]